MSNNGFRLVIDRRGPNCFFWVLNLRGEEFEGRCEPTVLHAADAAENYFRQLESSRHFKQRSANFPRRVLSGRDWKSPRSKTLICCAGTVSYRSRLFTASDGWDWRRPTLEPVG
jgi:hypothetical protein